MTAHQIGVFRVGSQQWHDARAGKMSGSRIAAAMGIHPQESRFSLWHRMNGTVGPTEVDGPMEWGNRLEGAVLQKFSETTAIRGGLDRLPGTWVNDDRDWQVCNPDGIWFPEGRNREVVEVKTARFDFGWGEPGTDQIPVHYRAQVLWELDTLDLHRAHIPVLISGSDYREYLIERDDTAEADILLMREVAQDFLASLEANEPPDVDDHTETYEALRELHPDIEPTSVDIPDDLAALWIQAKGICDSADDLYRLARSAMADHMGNAQYAYWNKTKIADRRARGNGRPYVQIAKDLPDLRTA